MAEISMKNASYEPLQKVQKDLKVAWYRCRIEHSRLRELMRPSDLQGWLQAGGHLGVAILTGAATVYFFHQGL